MRLTMLMSTLCISLAIVGCGGSSSKKGDSSIEEKYTSNSNGMKLTSNDIKPGKVMDKDLSGYGSGESPQLSWSGAPNGTKGYAFIMDDLSTKSTNSSAVVHWNFFTDNPSTTSLARDISGTANMPQDIVEGTNLEGNEGYAPPYPPKNEKHRYHFCIYAVNDVPTDIDETSSFTNEAFKKKYASIIIGNSCFDAYYTTSPSTNPSPTTSSDKKFKTVTPLRYVIENYKKLTDQDLAKYIKPLNDSDKSTLKIYEAFGLYIQYRACNVDNTIIMEGLMRGVQNCQQNLNGWLNTLYLKSTDATNYYTFEQWYYATQPDISKLSESEQDELFSYAYSEIKGLLIGMKCDTGEIDKKSCQTYFNGQAQAQNNINSLNDSRIRSYAEVTQQLYGCTYEGQVMDDGSVCTQ